MNVEEYVGHVRGPVLRLRVALLRPNNRRISGLRGRGLGPPARRASCACVCTRRWLRRRTADRVARLAWWNCLCHRRWVGRSLIVFVVVVLFMKGWWGSMDALQDRIILVTDVSIVCYAHFAHIVVAFAP